MDIEIPDKIYKLIVLLGVIIVGYSEIQRSTGINDWKKDFDNTTSLNDSLSLERISMDFEYAKIKNSADNFINIIEKTKQIKTFSTYMDSLNIVKGKLLLYKKKNDIYSKKAEQFSRKFKFLKEDFSQINKINQSLQNIGIILFCLGIFMWMINEAKDSRILLKQNEKLYPWCQSCGKKFSSIIKYGTNKDSTNNYSFCKTCYTKGKFNNPTLTKEEFLMLVQNEIANKNWWSRQILMSRFRTLERWKDDMY
ncbi:putative zinc ribbon domain protein [compost metagenome]